MPGRQLLIINAGSSSLKFAVYALDGAEPAASLRGQIAGIGQGKTRLDLSDTQIAAGWPFTAEKVSTHQAALRFLVERLG